MPVEFKLPDLGEGIHEAEIIAVKVKEGETVKEDQIIFEVETDKAVVEIPSPYGGVVTKISVAAGQIVTVGSTMIAYELGGSAAKTVAPAATKKAADNGKGHAAALSAGAPVASAQVAAAVGAAVIDRSRPVPATPATRRLARELSIDLHLVHGSGPAGRVLKEDVMAFAAGSLEARINGNAEVAPAKGAATKAAAPANQPSVADRFGAGGPAEPLTPLTPMSSGQPVEYPDFGKYGKVERLPLKSIRRKIAVNMTQAWTHIPHVTH